MKKTIGIFLLLLTAGFSSSAYAANLYWVGDAAANTNVATNWKTTDPSACGSGDASAAPTTTDIAIFDADCDNGATINAMFSVLGVDIKSGYTGTVTQASSITIATGSSGWTQADGVFTGSNTTITIGGLAAAGNVALSGGTFTSTSGAFIVYGSWSNTGATFTHSSGTVIIAKTGNMASSTGATKRFYNLTIGYASAGTFTTTLTDHLEVENTLTMTGTTGSFASTPNLVGSTNDKNVTVGNLTITGTAAKYTSGAATTTVTGTYTSTSTSDTDWTTDDGTLYLKSNTNQTLPDEPYHHIELDDNGGGATTYTLGATTTVQGNLTIDAGATLDTSSGNNYGINLAGNWSNSGAFTERSGTVTFNGTAAQTLTGETFYDLTINNSVAPSDTDDVDSSAAVTVSNTLTVTDGQFQPTTASSFKNVTISTDGILKPDSAASISLTGNWANTGTFTANSGTVTFNGTAAQTLTGETFYDLTINNSVAPSDTDDVDSSAAVTVSNTLTVTDGQFQPTTASSFKNVTISTDGILKPDASASITVTGNWTNSGTFTHNSGTVTITATSNLAGGTGATKQFYNLTISTSATTFTVTLTDHLDVANTLSLSGNSSSYSCGCDDTCYNYYYVTLNTYSNNKNVTTINLTVGSYSYYTSGTGTTTVNGTYTRSGTTDWTTYDGTLKMMSNTSQTLVNETYHHLELDDNGGGATTYTLPTTTTVQGNLTIDAGATLDASGSSYGLTVTGNWSNSGTFTARSGTVTFNAGDTDNTIDPGSSSSFYRVTFNNSSGAWDLTTNNATVTNVLTITAGIFDLNSKNLTATGATFSNAGTLRLAGGETVTGLTMDTDSGTVIYDGTGTYSSGLAAGDSYYSLTFNGSGTWTLDANLDVNGNLTLTQGTLDVKSGSNYQINIARNYSHTSGVLSEQQGKVVFDGSVAQTLTGETFYDLEVANTHASPSDSNDVDSSAAVTVTGTLTVSDGQFQPTTASSFANVTITTNGILKPDASAAITVSGNWSNTGTFTANSGTVTFNGTAAQTLTRETFYDLTINNSYASPDDTYDVDSSAAVTVSNTLTVTDGQFQPATSSSFKDVTISAAGILKPDSGAAITVSGNWTNSGTFTPYSGTVTFDGTSSGTLVTGGTGTGYDFYNLTLNKTSSTDASDNLALSTNNLVISGTLTVTDGEFLQSGDVDITAATTSVGSAGKWNITGGTTTDKVVVTIGSGGVTNAGTISFNGLAGGTGGGDADVIQIRSSTSGTQRTWTSSGSPTFTMIDADVKDQTTSPTTLEIDVLSGTDSANNTRWFFDDKTEHLVITTAQPTTLAIGSSVAVTITAKNNLGNTVTSGYSGDKTLTFSGPSVTSSGQYATASDKNNLDVNFGTSTTVTFTCVTSGCTATSTLKLYKSETVSVDASDGTYSTTGSADYDLDLTVTSAAGAALKFTTEPAPSEILASAVFTTQPAVAIVDSYGNTVTDDSASEVTLTAVLSSDDTTVAPGTLSADTNPVTVTSGVATFSGVKYNQSGTIKLKATSGSLTSVLSGEIKVVSAKGSVYLTDVNGLEKLGYNIGEAVYIKVTDDDENTDSTTKQTVKVTITNQSSGDTEKVTLEESGDDTGIFTNKNGTTPPHAPLPSTIRTIGIPDNFMLEVSASGGNMVAQYTDDDDSSDVATDSAGFGSISFNVAANVAGPVKAGDPFDLIVTAVSGAGGAGTPLISYTGSAALSVEYVSPSSGTKTISPSAVSAFAAGTATVSVQYPDAGKIKVKATDAAESAMTGESQELVIIPASLDVSIPVTPLTVGKDFEMTVTAQSVSGQITPNYQGMVNLEAHGDGDGTAGALLTASGSSFSNGIWTLTNRYGLWGKIYISATDSVYGNVTGQSQTIDFIPDKLEVKLSPPLGSRAAGNLYTYYSGETFDVTIRALDSSSQAISNYGGTIAIKTTSGLTMPAGYQFGAVDSGVYRFDVAAISDQVPFTVEAADSAWPQVTGTSSPSAEVVTVTVKVESAYGTTGQPVEVKVRLVDSLGRTVTQDSTTVVHLIFYVDGKKLSEDSLLPTVTLPEMKALNFVNGVASFTVSSSEIKTITILAQPSAGSVIQESLPGTVNIGSIGGRNVRILTWNEVRSSESAPAPAGSNRKSLVLQ